MRQNSGWKPTKLQIKDLGQLHYFLGIEVQRKSKDRYLSQKMYVLDMLQGVGFTKAKSVDSIVKFWTKLQADEGKLLKDVGNYSRLVGKMIYQTITRPEFSFVVSLVSHFMQLPRLPHWNAIVRILKYWKGCPNKGLLDTKHKTGKFLEVEGFADADWAVSLSDQRSTSGYCVKLGGNLVLRKS